MDSLLIEFKERMHIFHDAEDENLIRILKASKEYVKSKCGTFPDDNEQVKEIVFERSRYAYNDSIEFFEDNFISQLLSLSLENYEEGDVVE